MPEPVTMHGLEKWFSKEYEHLGWMFLAKKHGNFDKIKVYHDSVNRLIDDIQYKINELKGNPSAVVALSDLQVLLTHSVYLKSLVEKHLLTSSLVGGAKRSSKKSSKRRSKKSSKKSSRKSSNK